MSLYKMDTSQILKFVRMYKGAECLWNSRSVKYKDRFARDVALREISAAMGIRGFGPREVAQKIKNLRTTYNQEVKKIHRSRTSPNGIYQPKVCWFDILNSFLWNHTQVDLSSQNNAFSSEDYCDTSSHCRRVEEDPLKYIKEEPSSPEEVEEIIPDVTYTLKRPFDNVSCTETSAEEVKVVSKVGRFEEAPDEFSVFGSYIAAALRSLPLLNAITAQTKIMNVLMEEKRKSMVGQEDHGYTGTSPDVPSSTAPSEALSE